MALPIGEIVKLALGGQLARVSLQPFRVGSRIFNLGNQADLTDLQAFEFQYWPEAISDTKEVNYGSRQPIGGSNPIYQWISSGERNISFSAVFTNEIQNLPAFSQQFITPLLGFENRFSVDIPGAIAWLRQFMYPTYSEEGDIGEAIPPQRLLLTVPGTNLGTVGTVSKEGGVNEGDRGGDIIAVIMRACNVTYQSWFPDGTLRAAAVELSFSETVQKQSIRFASARDFRTVARRYRLTVPVTR